MKRPKGTEMTHIASCRISEDEMYAIRDYCESKNTTLSEFLRDAINKKTTTQPHIYTKIKLIRDEINNKIVEMIGLKCLVTLVNAPQPTIEITYYQDNILYLRQHHITDDTVKTIIRKSLSAYVECKQRDNRRIKNVQEK